MLPEDADVLAPSCDVAGLGTPLALVGPTVLVAFGVAFDVADMLVCKDGDGPSSFLGKFMSVHKASLNQNNCSSIATNRQRTYEDFVYQCAGLESKLIFNQLRFNSFIVQQVSNKFDNVFMLCCLIRWVDRYRRNFLCILIIYVIYICYELYSFLDQRFQ